MTENSIPQGTNLDDVDGKGVYMRPSTNPESTNIVVNMAGEMGPEGDDAETSEDDDAGSITAGGWKLTPAETAAHAKKLSDFIRRDAANRREAARHAAEELSKAKEMKRANRLAEWRLREQQQAVIRAAELADGIVEAEAAKQYFIPFGLVVLVGSVVCGVLGLDAAQLVLFVAAVVVALVDWAAGRRLIAKRQRAARQMNLVLHLIGAKK